jgi:hypothetical protein
MRGVWKVYHNRKAELISTLLFIKTPILLLLCKYITTICAVNNHDCHETVERSYVIFAINSFEATNLAAQKFWKEINPLSYTYVHQNTSLLTLEDLFG